MSDGTQPLTVIHDASCGLCVRLAEYGSLRSGGALEFIPWQEFAKSPEAGAHFTEEERTAAPRQLRVLSQGDILDDAEAWEAILVAYPPFESLTWIAERLGFMGAVSRVTMYGGQWLRGHCGAC